MGTIDFDPDEYLKREIDQATHDWHVKQIREICELLKRSEGIGAVQLKDIDTLVSNATKQMDFDVRKLMILTMKRYPASEVDSMLGIVSWLFAELHNIERHIGTVVGECFKLTNGKVVGGEKYVPPMHCNMLRQYCKELDIEHWFV